MASTNHTTNYNLPQWVATDPVLRTDFNAAFSAIDTAIAAAVTAAASADQEHVRVGSYTGNYTGSRTISLPWAPKCVILLGHVYSSEVKTMVSILTSSVTYNLRDSSVSTDTTNSPTLSGSNIIIHSKNWQNYNNQTVYYIALR